MKITYLNHRVFGKSEVTRIPKDIPIPEYRELTDVLKDIQKGIWCNQIQNCRAFLLSEQEKEYEIEKRQLPVLMPSGIFTGQGINSLASPTNILILDFDHLPQKIEVVAHFKEVISNDPYTFVSFISVSGFGIKAFIRLDNDIDNQSHHEYFQAVKGYYTKKYPELMRNDYWDESSKNINRLCYISHDPSLFFNPNSLIWTLRTTVNPSSEKSTNHHIELDDHDVEKIIRFLEGGWKDSYPMTDGHRHDSTFFRAKELAEWGIDKEYAELYFKQFLTEANNPDDIKRQIKNAYDKANFNSKRRKL